MYTFIHKLVFLGLLFIIALGFSNNLADGSISPNLWQSINRINQKGDCLGIVVPNSFELRPLLQSPSYVPHSKFPDIDFAGKTIF